MKQIRTHHMSPKSTTESLGMWLGKRCGKQRHTCESRKSNNMVCSGPTLLKNKLWLLVRTTSCVFSCGRRKKQSLRVFAWRLASTMKVLIPLHLKSLGAHRYYYYYMDFLKSGTYMLFSVYFNVAHLCGGNQCWVGLGKN